MKYRRISITLIFVCAAVGVAVYRFFDQSSRKMLNQSKSATVDRSEMELTGFEDWVKQPEFKQAAAEYFDAIQSIEAPADIPEDQLQRMVARLFVQDDPYFTFHRLKAAGAKAVPFLLQALADPRTATIRFGDGNHALDAQSPFERICDLLDPLGPVEAAVPLARFINHEDKHFRNHAAMALGKIGSSECIEPLLKALGDDDDYVRSYAMIGIRDGMNARRCEAEFLNAMFPALTQLLSRRDLSVSGMAPQLLLAMDAQRAMPVLLSDQYFTPANRELHYIIEALNQAGQKIPHAYLLPLLVRVAPLIGEYPNDYAYAAALLAYAANPDSSAESSFRRELESSCEMVREAAANSLAILAGVTDAYATVLAREVQSGSDSLSSPQLRYVAIIHYDAEVRNGGHSQYFVNSFSERWKFALDGLTVIGAPGRAEVLRAAAALFGNDGPSEDTVLRHAQLARFNTQQDKLLSELDTAYYSLKEENISILLAQYAVKHKRDFIAPK